MKDVGQELCVVPRDLLKPFRRQIIRALEIEDHWLIQDLG